MRVWRDRTGNAPARPWRLARTFLAWWARSLAAWLPAHVRRALGFGGDRLVIDPSGPSPRVYRQCDDGGTRLLSEGLADLRGDLAHLPRWLLVPTRDSLSRRVALPPAAESRLREVVSFEIDRQTPFAPSDVAHDAFVAERRKDGQIVATLVVVPLRSLQVHLDAIGNHASRLAGIDVADGSGVPLGVNLLAADQRYRPKGGARLVDMALLAIVVVLVGVAMSQSLASRQRAADDFESIVRERVNEARNAAVQRKRLEELVAGQAFVDRERQGTPRMLDIMSELTRRIPGHTYIEMLTFEGDKFTLVGLSDDPSSLVTALADSPLWRDAALTGSVQPDSVTRKQRFTLGARLAVAAPDASGRDNDNPAPH